MSLKEIYLRINQKCSNSFCYSVNNTSFDSSIRKIAVSPQVNLKQENNLVLEKERAIFLSLDKILQVTYKYKTDLSESQNTFMQDNNFRRDLPHNRKSLKRVLNLNSIVYSLGNWFFSVTKPLLRGNSKFFCLSLYLWSKVHLNHINRSEELLLPYRTESILD